MQKRRRRRQAPYYQHLKPWLQCPLDIRHTVKIQNEKTSINRAIWDNMIWDDTDPLTEKPLIPALDWDAKKSRRRKRGGQPDASEDEDDSSEDELSSDSQGSQ